MKYLVLLCFFIGNIIDKYNLGTNKTILRYFSGLLASISAKIRSNANTNTFIQKGMKNHSNWEFINYKTPGIFSLEYIPALDAIDARCEKYGLFIRFGESTYKLYPGKICFVFQMF